MSRVAITGANGFIGHELSKVCQLRGHEVARLTRRRTPAGSTILWRLGEPLPSECEDVDAVVHLASAALVETTSIAAAAEDDAHGSQILIDGVRQLRKTGRRIKFIFVSSQSARSDAPNIYGRSKWTIERMLGQEDEIIVRPGLVYGDQAASVFGLFDKLARLPIVPLMVGHANIQPIHVRELAECIAQIIMMQNPPHLFKLGAVNAMTLEDTIRATARRMGRRQPIVIPLPPKLTRFMAGLLDLLFRLTPSLTERIDGLRGLLPMETEESLRALGQKLVSFEQGRPRI